MACRSALQSLLPRPDLIRPNTRPPPSSCAPKSPFIGHYCFTTLVPTHPSPTFHTPLHSISSRRRPPRHTLPPPPNTVPSHCLLAAARPTQLSTPHGRLPSSQPAQISVVLPLLLSPLNPKHSSLSCPPLTHNSNTQNKKKPIPPPRSISSRRPAPYHTPSPPPNGKLSNHLRTPHLPTPRPTPPPLPHRLPPSSQYFPSFSHHTMT